MQQWFFHGPSIQMIWYMMTLKLSLSKQKLFSSVELRDGLAKIMEDIFSYKLTPEFPMVSTGISTHPPATTFRMGFDLHVEGLSLDVSINSHVLFNVRGLGPRRSISQNSLSVIGKNLHKLYRMRIHGTAVRYIYRSMDGSSFFCLVNYVGKYTSQPWIGCIRVYSFQFINPTFG